MDPLVSRIFMILFLEPEEVSLEELSERTGYSLASIHNKMKLLEKVGHLKKIRKPGTKKVFYYMEKDMMKTFRDMLERTYHQHIEPAKDFLPQFIERYRKERLTEPEKKKLDIIIRYHKQLLKMEKIVQKIHDEFASCQERSR
jgi:DNA-binding transcriptional regulator GbsR (MarR family)